MMDLAIKKLIIRPLVGHDLRGPDQGALQRGRAGIHDSGLGVTHHGVTLAEDDADIFPVPNVPGIVRLRPCRRGSDHKAVVWIFRDGVKPVGEFS